MRIYDNKYLSVTSIVGLRDPFDDSSFKKWCELKGLDSDLIANTSRILGEKVSNIISNADNDIWFLNPPPVDSLEERLFGAVEDFLSKWELVSTEKEVYCDELNYAGRYDGIIRRKNSHEIVLADWKTFGAWSDKPYKRDSKKIKHTRWQLSLYAYALEWKSPIGVVIFKNDGTWELEKLTLDEDMIKWVRDNQDLILETIKDGENQRLF